MWGPLLRLAREHLIMRLAMVRCEAEFPKHDWPDWPASGSPRLEAIRIGPSCTRLPRRISA
eukprot:4718760-Pyramimonas_sp.AAC.1